MAVAVPAIAGAIRSLGAFGDRMPRAPAISQRPMIGILAVLIGAFIATLGGRVTSFGLADIRGAVHAGVDEGAWITTASTVGQMALCAPTVWMGLVYGPRRILLISTTVLAATSLLTPFSDGLYGMLALQFIGGLAMGTFYPLTVSFVMRNLPPRLVIYGIAAYAMNSELSLNISASLEGWYLDHASWHWIFWQNAILAAFMWVCVYMGIPRRPVQRDSTAGVDKSGMIYFSLGFSLIYAALDQGDRLDWLNDGLITGLLLGGGLLLACFLVRGLTCEAPWLDLRYIAFSGIWLPMLMLVVLRLAILSTSYLIPQYLITVQGYRALQVGQVLLLVAVPQIMSGPLIATILRFTDPRYFVALGYAMIAGGCLWVAATLTPEWGSDDFMPAQIIQSLGQSFGMTALVAYNLRLMRPEDALTFGTVLQTTRMIGGELGSAFIQTLIRVREQYHSNILGQQVTAGTGKTLDRLQEYIDAVTAHSPGTAVARATGMLAGAVQKQAYVLAYIDGFTAIGVIIILCLALMVMLRPPIQPPPG
jgi:MFS transporter, DHA2 family, multidrug resistance protein